MKIKLICYKINLLTLLILLLNLYSHAQSVHKVNEEELNARMQWWKDSRFGMFIHWGVYSTFGGEWKGVDYGKEMGGASAEWIYLRAGIQKEEYEKAAHDFNPVNYDPAEWVKMAKDAGMKYIVLTSKHHDGFALFDTKASGWNIMKASVYGKDIIKSYIEECHKQGMRVGLYYSHEKDWYHHEKVQKDTSAITEEYRTIVKTHLEELLTNYGQIDLMWFDMGISQHKELNQLCYNVVRRLQPNCIISSRIGNNLGDYRNLRDRELAPPGTEGYVESIMTLRLNWGYDKNDSYWKSSEEVISMLSKCACRNSNFLLNIGPQPDGRFTQEEMIRLRNIGDWMELNSVAIYKTSGSPFKGEYEWGSLTSKDDKAFLHLFDWQGGTIQANGILNEVKKVYLLHNGRELNFKQNSDNAELCLFVPDDISSEVLYVVVLELDSDLKVDVKRGPILNY